MKCPHCKEIKLKVNRTVNLDGSPMTVRYYICPKCNVSFGSTERLDKRYSNNQMEKSEVVEGVGTSNA